ncbi:uncharacterized protein cubi_01325 [Cryptosporidium ubiquitum]|uniref:Uncharacterized protein n=1 Tax=Cryptosporidium ubiquitum TaxID=857276 RepID=A0A1J4MCL3_9CRYT|nr:uncharacterized protein cubi_01325 [Cryptosporidium ubiquitum]OII71711.1 hypothetical protein cubi_01325 [Cryptosporidium ubiquitum]
MMADLIMGVNFEDKEKYIKEYDMTRSEDIVELIRILKIQEDSRKALEEEIKVIVSNNDSLRQELISSNEMVNYWKDQYEICNTSLRIVNEEFEQLKVHDENMNTFNKTFKSMECKKCGYEWKRVNVENDNRDLKSRLNDDELENFLDITNILVSSLYMNEVEGLGIDENDQGKDRKIDVDINKYQATIEKDQEIGKLKIENEELKILLEKKEKIIIDLQNELGQLKSKLMVEKSLPNVFKVVSKNLVDIVSEDDSPESSSKVISNDDELLEKFKKNYLEQVKSINKKRKIAFCSDNDLDRKELKVSESLDILNDLNNDDKSEEVGDINRISYFDNDDLKTDLRYYDNYSNNINTKTNDKLLSDSSEGILDDIIDEKKYDNESNMNLKIVEELDWEDDNWGEDEEKEKNEDLNYMKKELENDTINEKDLDSFNKEKLIDNEKITNEVEGNKKNVTGLTSFLDDFVSHISGSINDDKIGKDDNKNESSFKDIFDSYSSNKVSNVLNSNNFNNTNSHNIPSFTGFVSNIKSFFNDDKNKSFVDWNLKKIQDNQLDSLKNMNKSVINSISNNDHDKIDSDWDNDDWGFEDDEEEEDDDKEKEVKEVKEVKEEKEGEEEGDDWGDDFFSEESGDYDTSRKEERIHLWKNSDIGIKNSIEYSESSSEVKIQDQEKLAKGSYEGLNKFNDWDSMGDWSDDFEAFSKEEKKKRSLE